MYTYSINGTTGEKITKLKEFTHAINPNADARGVFALENGTYIY